VKKFFYAVMMLCLTLGMLSACETDGGRGDSTIPDELTAAPVTTEAPITTAAPVTTRDLEPHETEPDVTVPSVIDPTVIPSITICPEKPVIYLYPTAPTRVSVKLDYAGTLTSTYPAYPSDGWCVDAQPDGTLTDPATGREYYCLFWEGEGEDYTIDSGFVVAGKDTEAFLEDALAKLGLTRREANEFIIYWLPRMEGNAYNLISFDPTAYLQDARLTVNPAPDTVIRVFMTWRGLDAPMDIPAQTLTAPVRTGFTLVEWGGAELD